MNHVVSRHAIGFLFSAIVGCPESHAPWPTLGQLSDSDPTILVHISANTFAPSNKIRRNGIEFSCGVDPGTAAIIYVATFDNDFRTVRKVCVFVPFARLVLDHRASQIQQTSRPDLAPQTPRRRSRCVPACPGRVARAGFRGDADSGWGVGGPSEEVERQTAAAPRSGSGGSFWGATTPPAARLIVPPKPPDVRSRCVPGVSERGAGRVGGDADSGWGVRGAERGSGGKRLSPPAASLRHVLGGDDPIPLHA